MENSQLAQNIINTLCSYFGEKEMFEVFIERWGVQEIYDILSEILVGDQSENDGEG